MTPIKSYTNRHGRTVHYDEAGHKVGESYRSPSGGRVIHYDASGREVGRSYGNPSGRMTHYDSSGNRTGTSYTAYPGRVRHYNASGQKTGDTVPTFFGNKTEGAGRTDAPRQNGADGGGSQAGATTSAGCACVLLLFAVVGFIGLVGAFLR